MNTREKQLLAGGLLVGVLVATMVYVGIGVLRPHFPLRPALVTKDASAGAPVAGSQQSGTETAGPVEGEPLTSVQLTDEEQLSISLQTVAVERRRIQREVIAAGRVEQAETQISAISARIGGRVDELLVKFTGQEIRPGQPIARIYSPEVVASAEEYKLAVENRQRLGEGAARQAIVQANDLVTASRRRFELWGLTAEQIRNLSDASQENFHITISSQVGGIITERKVTEGQYVKEGDVLYTVTDLNTLWVIADVYENDLSDIRVGEVVEITSDTLPGIRLRGKVNFLEPQINQQTRTLPVRIQVPNPGMRLRPGMFVKVILRPSTASVLTVPRSSVLRSGMRNIVYVATGNGVFEGRTVTLGAADDKNYPIVSGLREGERVVTEGNFMLDSQSRIAGGMTGMFGGSKEFEREEQSQRSSTATAKVAILFRTAPDPPKGASENGFHVSITDETRKPIAGAKVKVTLVMPAMPAMGMPEMRSSSDLTWNGSEYVAKPTIPMAGSWNVTVEANRDGTVLGTYHTRISAR